MKRISLVPFHLVEDEIAGGGDAADAAITNIETARLRRHVRQLEPLQARVIRWRFGLDPGQPPLSHRKIAERLGLSVGTCFNLEQRALAALRRRYRLEDAA